MVPAEAEHQWQGLQQKVAFLKQPSSYPEQAGPVVAIETHMSWVFLTNAYAYKIKKPVNLPFLDFSSLEARRLSIDNELALNAPLAPGVYLDVLALRKSDSAGFQLGGAGNEQAGAVVDWVLRMKRLPQALMLDRALASGNCSQAALLQAARTLAAYYLGAPRVAVTPSAYVNNLGARVQENRGVLGAAKYQLDAKLVDAVHMIQLDLIRAQEALLLQRVSDGRIVDGHGDLKPEHICLTEPPVIIDRQEADHDLRAVDPIDELSFLYIECRLLGHPEAAEVFFAAYRDLCADQYPDVLLPLFKSLRACTRARFAAWHLDDPRVQDKEKWRKKTAAYFALSQAVLG